MASAAALLIRERLPAEAPRAQAMPAPLLTVVVPTFNERDNVAALVKQLDSILSEVAWEVVFVDDNSPDGTASAAKALSREDTRVRCLRRVGRRGLAGATIEGMLSSSAPYVAVMDGDLQHDASILPEMLAALMWNQADIVVGSRHVDGGSNGEGLSGLRARISAAGTGLARLALRTGVRDVMSGFFMLRREIVEEAAPRLCSSGFKILADILASSPEPLRELEVAYQFGKRHAGSSKFDMKNALDFMGLMVNKFSRGVIPVPFFSFALVGAAGVALHMAVLKAALASGLPFGNAQLFATIVAMVSNFFINNLVTYRDSKLKGFGLVLGLVKFCAVCALGAIANVGAALWFFNLHATWWLAGLAGVVMGAVWNYTLSSLFVWRRQL